MAKEDNLKKGNAETQFTSGLKAVESGRAGGIASGKAKKKRKTLRESYLAIAELPFQPVGKMATSIKKKFPELSVDEAIMMAMTIQASNGNVKAAEYIRDTIGEKDAKVSVEFESDGFIESLNESIGKIFGSGENDVET